MPPKIDYELTMTRFAGTLGLEFRKAEDGKSEIPVIYGYAAKYNVLSDVLYDWAGPFRERILPGAFTEDLLKKCDCRGLINHDPNLIVARSAYGQGTLKLSVDDVGLKFEFTPPKRSYVDDLIDSIRTKDVDGCSFAFRVAKEKGDRWSYGDNTDIREILLVSSLVDISIVTYPAYPQTEASVRSSSDWSQSRKGYIDTRKNHLERVLAARQAILSAQLRKFKED